MPSELSPVTPSSLESPSSSARMPMRVTVGDCLSPNLRESFKSQIRGDLAWGYREFVLNFATCPYVDSRGLAALTAIGAMITAARGTLVLEQMPPDLRKVFALTRLETLFTIRESAAPSDVEVPIENRHAIDDAGVRSASRDSSIRS